MLGTAFFAIFSLIEAKKDMPLVIGSHLRGVRAAACLVIAMCFSHGERF
jgi:hypothetical protein